MKKLNRYIGLILAALVVFLAVTPQRITGHMLEASVPKYEHTIPGMLLGASDWMQMRYRMMAFNRSCRTATIQMEGRVDAFRRINQEPPASAFELWDRACNPEHLIGKRFESLSPYAQTRLTERERELYAQYREAATAYRAHRLTSPPPPEYLAPKRELLAILDAELERAHAKTKVAIAVIYLLLATLVVLMIGYRETVGSWVTRPVIALWQLLKGAHEKV